MTTSEEYEEQSAQCMVWAGNSAEQQRTLDAQLNALGGVQQALLGVMVELRRSNEDRVVFYGEMLSFFERLTEEPQPGPDGSLRSGQPAAAAGCPVCERPLSNGECPKGAQLTCLQWLVHRDAVARTVRDRGASPTGALEIANRETRERFGPCPEES